MGEHDAALPRRACDRRVAQSEVSSRGTTGSSRLSGYILLNHFQDVGALLSSNDACVHLVTQTDATLGVIGCSFEGVERGTMIGLRRHRVGYAASFEGILGSLTLNIGAV